MPLALPKENSRLLSHDQKRGTGVALVVLPLHFTLKREHSQRDQNLRRRYGQALSHFENAHRNPSRAQV
jgi:hypothetical protein